MQILKIDRKNNWFEVVPDTFEDLWHLEKLVEKGDIVSGSAERKIKPKNEGDSAYREKIFVELEAQKAIFHEATNQLRIQGVVVGAVPVELVPLKSHHTLEAEIGKKIKVTKKALKNFHTDRLTRAKEATGREKVLLVVMDDETADIAFLKDTGLEMKAHIGSMRHGKRFKDESKESPYFEELLNKISELKAGKIVVAGPGFERQNFEKYAKGKNAKLQIFFESTNSVGITGLNELVKAGKIDKIIGELHSAEEAKIVEKLLAAIPNEMAAIGFKEVNEALHATAANEVAMLENMLTEKRSEAENLLDMAQQSGAKIIFISQKSEAGRQLEGFGGVGATLRYRRKWQ